jgi:hypothetical protein
MDFMLIVKAKESAFSVSPFSPLHSGWRCAIEPALDLLN